MTNELGLPVEKKAFPGAFDEARRDHELEAPGRAAAAPISSAMRVRPTPREPVTTRDRGVCAVRHHRGVDALAKLKLQLVNLGTHPETLETLDTLRDLVSVQLESLGACDDAVPVLQEAKLARKLPLTWAPNKKLTLGYDVVFDCANDGSAGTPDYAVSARVDHLVLGGADEHPEDDVCPRSVPPPRGVEDACGQALGVDVTGP